jgi:iron complex transport system ATP-binding protein
MMMNDVLALEHIGVRRGGRQLLNDVTFSLPRGQHLCVLGPNGSGKTTLLHLLSTYRHPTSGTMSVLGVTFGTADLRELRPAIGFVSNALDTLLHGTATARELVAVARFGGTWPPKGLLDDKDLAARADQALARVGAAHLGDRVMQTLSQGERQRVRIARALVIDPQLVLLDEPFAGLDLGGREALLRDLDLLLAEENPPSVVLVTHHLEELPRGIDNVLLLKDGMIVAAGPRSDTLTNENLSTTFGLPITVRAYDGRYSAMIDLA